MVVVMALLPTGVTGATFDATLDPFFPAPRSPLV
jgi:hypothetical protein